MKNIKCIIISALFLMFQSVLGLNSAKSIPPWSDQEINQVRLALRYNSEGLSEFLSRIEMCKSEKEFNLSWVDKVEVKKQITVSKEDIFEQKPINTEKIFKIDLRDVDFAEDKSKLLLDYFNNDLPNLRHINLEKSTNVSIFFEKIFGNNEPPNKFVSLSRINADSTDLASQDLDNIFNHFSMYSYFIRDMEQISARYDVVAAFLTIDLRNLQNDIENISLWQRGKKTRSSWYKIFYRRNKHAEIGPLIITN